MGNLKGFSAADIGARQFVVTSYHVRLRFGEAGAVALIGVAGQLSALTPNHPCHFVFSCLAAFGADERMRSLLRSLVEEFAFFHSSPRGRLCPSDRNLSPGIPGFHSSDEDSSPGTRFHDPSDNFASREARRVFHSGSIYSILVLTTKERKQAHDETEARQVLGYEGGEGECP